MSKIIKGDEINKAMIDTLVDIVRGWAVRPDLQTQGKMFVTDFKDDKGENISILSEDNDPSVEPERYTLIKDLLQAISFDKKSDEELYEIPNVRVPKDLKDKANATKTTIYITKASAIKLAKKGKAFKKELGIDFPQELHQLNHSESLIPGLSYQAPEPKKLSETQEEYEARMEQHYKKHGYDKEPLGKYREAYPHEKVNYELDKPEMTNIARDSYLKQLNDKSLDENIAEHGGEGMEEGKPRVVVDTDPTLGQRIRDIFNAGKGIVKSNTVRNGLLAAGGIAAGAAIISWAPLGFTAVAVSTAAFIGLGAIAKKYGKPLLKKIKAKLDDFFKGKVIEETPEPTKKPGKERETEPEKRVPEPERPGTKKGEVPQHGAPITGQTPTNGTGTSEKPAEHAPVEKQSTPQNIEIPEELMFVLKDIEDDKVAVETIEREITQLESRKSEHQSRIDNPNSTLSQEEKENIQKQIQTLDAQIAKCREIKREHLTNMYEAIQGFIYGNNMDKGGPRL